MPIEFSVKEDKGYYITELSGTISDQELLDAYDAFLNSAEWKPGLNTPFDPIASKKAQENNFKVIVIGNDLDNFRRVLDDKEFIGSVIG